MASNNVKLDLQGIEDLTARLKRLQSSVAQKIMKRALTKGTSSMLAAMRAGVPRDTGLTKKAIGRKVKTYRSGNVVVLLGPRTGMRTVITPKRGGKPRTHSPTNIAHLIEYGHRIVASGTGTLERADGKTAGVSRVTKQRGKGKVGGVVAPRPFMRQAYEANKDSAMQTIRQEIAAGIEQEARS